MIMQGWPLWAVRQSTGQVYAVVGWTDMAAETTRPAETTRQPVMVEIGPMLDGRPLTIGRNDLRFFTDHKAVLRVTR